jgi:hypothetical protein
MSQVSKQKQRERIVAQFMNFTQSNEKNAIHFLSQHDWKLDLAVDAYYLSLDSGPRVTNAPKTHSSTDRKKLDQIWNLYKGINNIQTNINIFKLFVSNNQDPSLTSEEKMLQDGVCK